MNREQLKKLVIITLVILILVLTLSALNIITTNVGSSSLLKDKNQVNKVEITNGENKITLNKDDNQWKVENFNADNEKINGILDILQNTKLSNPISTNKNNHSVFEVSDTSNKRLSLYNDDERILNLYIGKATLGEEIYFRVEGQDKVYTLSDEVGMFVASGINDHRDKTIISESLDNMKRLKINDLEINNNNGTYEVANSNLDLTKVSELFRSASSIEADGFLSNEELQRVNQNTPQLNILITRQDDSTKNYTLFKLDDKYYVKLSDQEAYLINASKFDSLNKKLADLILT